MQRTRSKRELYVRATILIIAGVLVWVLTASDAIAWSLAMYNDSAHGDTTSGVNRSGIEQPTGDCTHCHDASDSPNCGQFGFMLFYDDTVGICDLFCYTCHSTSPTWQPVTNYPYSVSFGGGPTFYGTIYQQFCDANSTPSKCGSRHHLGQIHNNIKNNTLGWGFNSDPDPCVACHNPHADRENLPVEIVGGKLNTAIRRAPHYKSTDPTEVLWGDDASERMDQYVGQFTNGLYQAPYYGSFGSGQYEPAGDATSDGSNLPDYVTFCLDCHQYTLYDPETGKNIKPINYAMERHGGYPSNTCTNVGFEEGSLKAPYVDFPDSNYVLSCLDCHEPHGTLNRLHLIRRVINGQVLAAENGDGYCDQPSDFAEICTKCHDWPHPTWGGCTGCHGEHNGDDWHGTTFPFGGGTDSCLGEPSF